MRTKNNLDIQNIKAVEIIKSYSVAGKNICFHIQNAFTGINGDQAELLDEILINNMLEQMARALQSNCSR